MRSAQSATAVKVCSVIFSGIIVLVFYSSNKFVVDCEDGILDFLLATLESEVFLHITYLPVSIRLHVRSAYSLMSRLVSMRLYRHRGTSLPLIFIVGRSSSCNSTQNGAFASTFCMKAWACLFVIIVLFCHF